MAKDVYQFRCPCCHKQLEFETRTGKARHVTFDGDDAAKKMNDLQKTQREDEQRLGDIFQSAAKDQNKQAGKFDDMFSQALDEAKKDKDAKPRNPFDLE